MKIFALLVAMALLIGGSSCPALADDNDDTYGYQDTTRKWFHNHQVYLDQRRNPLGAGLDLVLFQSNTILEEVVAETKYDWQNDEMSGYIVGKVNLFKAVTGLFE